MGDTIEGEVRNLRLLPPERRGARVTHPELGVKVGESDGTKAVGITMIALIVVVIVAALCLF